VTDINRITEELVAAAMAERHPPQKFIPGDSPVPVTGKVFGKEELSAAVEASLDFWLTAGPYSEKFESRFAKTVGMRHAFMVNSGSSANLLALTSLTSPKHGDRALRAGDEVLTVAAGFPTTVTPIIQNNLIPVYVDVDLETYVANIAALESAIGPKTKAIMMAHTLGNPFNLDLVQKLAEKHNLWVIEDSCDALGGTYRGQTLGSFGDISTFSFYPGKNLGAWGDAGAIATNNQVLANKYQKIRDPEQTKNWFLRKTQNEDGSSHVNNVL
jgi:CDP-6-deoxy-D-xylo-4-hexulose-3-dehydrase